MTGTIATPPTPLVKTSPIPWAVFAVWIGATAFAFWFFELRFQRSFSSNEVAIFESSVKVREAEDWLRQMLATGVGTAGAKATVVDVTQPDCPCNRYAEPHLQEIVATYKNRGVSFLRGSGKLPGWIETTPAVLVFNSAGHLVYFGPYSDSAWCGVRGGLAERTLDELLKGGSPQPQRLITKGCFCGMKAS